MVDCFFFLGLIVFMGCSQTCVHASFLRILFHIIYLYSTPLCLFSDKQPDYFLVLMIPSLRNSNGLRLVSWSSVFCDWLNHLCPRPSAQRHVLWLYLLTMEVSKLLIILSPIETQRILVKRIVQNLCKHGS